ncbi:shTK domain protein [Ancylostoma caninum]|uniref:ShTK domain protein n=1 Tax=Ancylostoma caninum TaxID=29170 RepID=A0A368GAW7_ANCCA|nr:shTK domain protein [Ancylostoma caninum]
MEFAIRQIDPSLYLPYWDSTMDGRLAHPADSVLFTDALAGGTDAQGYVNSGPYLTFRTLEGQPHIKRAVGKQGQTMKDSDIDWVMRQTQVDQVMAFSAPRQGCPFRTDYNCLEYTHGNGHIFVGGDMFNTATSANDPLFYVHHCFIDYIWEQWRQQRQTRADRETLYPPDNQLCSSPQHFAASQMMPFTPMRNIDGLSNKYTDNLYEYAPRPTCAQGRECGSKYLFCDFSHGAPACVAKIKLGAPCTGYARGENPCYNGACVGGRCAATGPMEPPTLPPTPIVTAAPVIVAPQETCFNENECCGTWAAKGECTRNVGYMGDWCRASCGLCRPQYRLADGLFLLPVDFYTRIKSVRVTSRNESCKCGDVHATANRSTLPQQRCIFQTVRIATQTAIFGLNRENAPIMSFGWPRTAGNLVASAHGLGRQRAAVAAKSIDQQSNPSQCAKTQRAATTRTCAALTGPSSVNAESLRRGWHAIVESHVVTVIPMTITTDVRPCVDYHRECPGWARLGECEKNPWMSENCRASCRTCYSQWDLRDMCRGPVGTVAPVAQRRPQPSNGNSWGPMNVGTDVFDDSWGMGWGNGMGGGRSPRWEASSPRWGWFPRKKRE